MRYWQWKNEYRFFITKDDGIFKSKPATLVGNEVKKNIYDLGSTIPDLAKTTLAHNYFAAAETAIRKAMVSYKESLFTLTKVPNYGSVLTLSDTTTPLYNNFLQFEKAEEKATITRAITFYDAIIAGDSDKDASTKAQAIKIDLSSLKAENGKNEFTAYLFSQHPALIRTYATYVNNLGYTTLLTEDEPEGTK